LDLHIFKNTQGKNEALGWQPRVNSLRIVERPNTELHMIVLANRKIKMTAKITFYPVDNGDMTLIELESEEKLLLDCFIKKRADDDNDDSARDVATDLRETLTRDKLGRLYVDVMMLSHPDADHCSGLEKHFHCGPPGEWVKTDDKILIREMWSSPMIFRRASKNMPLCSDAKAWAKEARRRVKYFSDGKTLANGERILVLGEDEDDKTDKLQAILIKVGETIEAVNGDSSAKLSVRLIGPIPDSEVGDEDEDPLSKNNSSIIANFKIEAERDVEACYFLTGGDAEVEIWNEVWAREKSNKSVLKYDILQAPHHCSWHSLSFDKWSEKGRKGEVETDALNALSQARIGAAIVSSSKPIKDNHDNPPCIGAKEVYENIENCSDFYCTGEHPDEKNVKPLVFEITNGGHSLKNLTAGIITAAVGIGATARKERGHG